MPPEWAPHERTWMAFPTANVTFGSADADVGDDKRSGQTERLHLARSAWAEVARTVARYEPVTLVASVGEADDARHYVGQPADGRVEIVERPLDDAWMRDIGPTFVVQDGALAAVDWTFNGWGGQEWAAWENDQHVAREVAALAGVPVSPSALVNEGGGLHVDGEGTVLLTETVQLDPGRNPGWTREQVEAEVHARLGTSTAIWLPRGLTRDYGRFGTRGHVDIVAAFLGPGVVAVHTQPDPAHPDYEVSRDVAALLSRATDARGRTLKVVELLAPTVLEEDGEPTDWSYVNHYVANGVVVMCAFDDPADADARDVLAQAYPDRRIELVDARQIFANGGGIHCITQQQPAV
jgi:agmatine deiminase